MWRRTYRAVPGTTTEVYTSSSASQSFVVPIDVRLRYWLTTRLCAEIDVSRARGGGPGLRGTTLTLQPFVRSKSVDIGHPPLPLPLRPAHGARHRGAQGVQPGCHPPLREDGHERANGKCHLHAHTSFNREAAAAASTKKGDKKNDKKEEKKGGGHGGGDLGLISTFVDAVRTGQQELLGTDVSDVLRSHLAVFAAVDEVQDLLV